MFQISKNHCIRKNFNLQNHFLIFLRPFELSQFSREKYPPFPTRYMMYNHLRKERNHNCQNRSYTLVM